LNWSTDPHLKEKFDQYVEYRKSLGDFKTGISLDRFREVVDRLHLNKRSAKDIDAIVEEIRGMRGKRDVKVVERTKERDEVI
jgi:hypothetical protein